LPEWCLTHVLCRFMFIVCLACFFGICTHALEIAH
jgi:hypothetical protein